MKVGVIADFYYPWIGGPAAAIRSLAHGLSERGHSVSLLVPSPDGRARSEREGPIEITRARSVPVPFGYRLRAALPPVGVTAWLDRTRPDVVHVHHPFPLSAASILAARRATVPIVATNHTIPSCSLWGIRELGPVYTAAEWALGRWIVALLHRCDSVATPTATAARLLQELGFRGPIEAISNGVDTERFAPGPRDAELRARLGIDGRPVVLYTGRLDAEKDMGTWLSTAAALSRQSDVQFVVGGEGSDRERLESLARELGIAPRTRFIGYLSYDELPRLYRLADIYFITSPVELQSISTLEAISSGLPVVAVDAAALPELVREAVNGYLVVHRDSEGASRALTRILQDDHLRRSMASASRELAIGHSIKRSVDSYERLFQHTVARARRDGGIERLSAAGC